MVCIPGKTGIDMKESGNSVSSMERGLTFMQTEMCTLETLQKGRRREKESFCMQMDRFIEDSSRTDYDTEGEFGADRKTLLQTTMKGNLKMIRNVDSGYLNGHQVTFTKEIF